MGTFSRICVIDVDPFVAQTVLPGEIADLVDVGIDGNQHVLWASKYSVEKSTFCQRSQVALRRLATMSTLPSATASMRSAVVRVMNFRWSAGRPSRKIASAISLRRATSRPSIVPVLGLR